MVLMMTQVKPKLAATATGPPDAQDGQFLLLLVFCFVKVMTRGGSTHSRGTSKTNNFKCPLLSDFSNDDTSCSKYSSV